jgi:hypothetical protein
LDDWGYYSEKLDEGKKLDGFGSRMERRGLDDRCELAEGKSWTCALFGMNMRFL